MVVQSVLALIVSICGSKTHQIPTGLNVKDTVVWIEHKNDVCVFNLNRCMRRKLKSPLGNYRFVDKEEAVSKCIDDMVTFEHLKKKR